MHMQHRQTAYTYESLVAVGVQEVLQEHEHWVEVLESKVSHGVHEKKCKPPYEYFPVRE